MVKRKMKKLKEAKKATTNIKMWGNKGGNNAMSKMWEHSNRTM